MTLIDLNRFIPEDIIVGYNDEIIDIKYSKFNESDYFLMITNSKNAKIMNKSNNTLQYLLQGHQ